MYTRSHGNLDGFVQSDCDASAFQEDVTGGIGGANGGANESKVRQQVPGIYYSPPPENIMFSTYKLDVEGGSGGLGLKLTDSEQNKRLFKHVLVDECGFQLEEIDAGENDPSKDAEYSESNASSKNSAQMLSNKSTSPRRSKRIRTSTVHIEPNQTSKKYSLPCERDRLLLEFTGELFADIQSAQQHTLKVTNKSSNEVLQLKDDVYMAPDSRKGAWLVQHSREEDANAILIIIPKVDYQKILKGEASPPSKGVYAYLKQYKPIAPGDPIQFEYSHDTNLDTLASSKTPQTKEKRGRGRPRKEKFLGINKRSYD